MRVIILDSISVDPVFIQNPIMVVAVMADVPEYVMSVKVAYLLMNILATRIK